MRFEAGNMDPYYLLFTRGLELMLEPVNEQSEATVLKCVSPLQLGDRTVACGQCIACRVNRTTDWTVRMIMELSTCESAVFGTLTYKDKWLPAHASLDKSELQRAIKRLRKAVEPDTRVKYYCSGEYGDVTGRPHYHGIFFGISLNDHEFKKIGKALVATSGPLFDAWRTDADGAYGHVYLGDVTPASIRYVAGYIQKKLGSDPAQYGGRLPPFALMSKSLGLEYVKNEENYKQLVELCGYRMNGKIRPIPRYFRKKFEELDELYSAEVLNKRLESNRETVEYLEKRSRFVPLSVRERGMIVDEERNRRALNAVSLFEKRQSLQERKDAAES